MTSATGSARKHQSACENAEGLDCDCGCAGPGHGKAILERCLRCAGRTDPKFAELADHLESIYGVFHADPSLDQRQFQRGRDDTRYFPPPSTADMATGAAATRLETVVLDDGVHEILLRTAAAPNTAVVLPFFDAITTDAIATMTAAVAAAGGIGHRTEDSHVWCSLVAEASRIHLSIVSSRRSAWPDFAGIGYPRQSTLKHPRTMTPATRTAGLRFLLRAISHFTSAGLSRLAIHRTLQLVAISSCTDVWHHPAVVRCAMTELLPPNYRATKYLAMPDYPDLFRDVTGRWKSRGNW